MLPQRRLAAPLLLVGLLAAWTPLHAQTPSTSSIASPAEFLGYDLGERFTDHAGVVRYMEHLAEASPLVEVVRYGESVERRALIQVVIARTDYRARLDEILAANRELTDPDTPESRAREIARTNPAVLYLSYGVHGNESSSSEAAMWTAWDLARGAEAVAGVLDSAIVVIDPVVNPDGRDRYVNWYRQVSGAEPNENPNAAEHWEPWPGGRFNHYLFDLNRDWAWMTQQETRARLATWERWSPQVHVDFHEMSWTSSYFFFPATTPINPIYPQHILEWGRRFGQANAAAFDQRGWAYYTAESFDLFYPGYGDSWPSLTGAIGMTYEQAGHGRAGLKIRRPDGTLLTLHDRAQHHRTTGHATLRTAATRKSELLLDFARFHRTVDQGLPDVLLVPGADRGRIDALVALLRGQGIVVEEATRAFRADAKAHQGFRARRDFPAGTYRVPARQPRGRLALTLLQPEVLLDATYSYDVSAWSLPYAYGVEAHTVDRVPNAGWQRIDTVRPVATGDVELDKASEPYGYLVAPSFSAWPAMVDFLEAGGRAIVLEKAFTLGGRAWPAGTFFLPRHSNEALADKVAVSGLAGLAHPVHSGWTEEGNDLGTGRAYNLSLPRIAVLMGDGVSATSYGAHWFFLEQTLGIPFDAIPVHALGMIQLDDYDVLVLPEMGRGALERSAEQIRDWVRRGGTVVAVGSGARAAASLLAQIDPRSDNEKESGDEARRRALRGRAARQLERWEAQVPGTILPLRLDADHPITFGAGIDGDPNAYFVLHTGGAVFEPDAAFETVAHFPANLQKVSGVISAENLERLSESTWLARKSLGRGSIILFADDPLFRHFWYSGFQLFTNALLIGPAL